MDVIKFFSYTGYIPLLTPNLLATDFKGKLRNKGFNKTLRP